MEYQRLTQAFLTENAALQQGRSLVARLGEVDFPANGFATVNILDQVQIVILATHWRGQVAGVQGPDLIGLAGDMGGRHRMPMRRLTAAPTVLLMGSTQHSVKAAFRADITALIGQARHNLTRRQVAKGFTVTQRQNALPFSVREGVSRFRAYRRRPTVRFQGVLLGPALEGAQANAQFITGRLLARTLSHGFHEPFDIVLPGWQRGQVSSLSSPQ